MVWKYYPMNMMIKDKLEIFNDKEKEVKPGRHFYFHFEFLKFVPMVWYIFIFVYSKENNLVECKIVIKDW